MTQLSFYLFGSPHITLDAQPIHMTRRRALALAIYLATTDHAHSRDVLTAFFWPEYDEQSARTDLRRTLYVINQTLGAEWLITEDDNVQFRHNGELWLDTRAFVQLLAGCDAHGHNSATICPACLPLLSEAVALYQDDFLAGFSLPDSPAFDDWHFFENEGLRNQLADALTRLVQGYSAGGDYARAIRYARRWLTLDPLNEAIHRWLMQLYSWNEQPSAALHQYDHCVKQLAEELDAQPDVATANLYAALKTHSLLPPTIDPTFALVSHKPHPIASTNAYSLTQTDDIRVVTTLNLGMDLTVGGAKDVELETLATHSTQLFRLAQSALDLYGGYLQRLHGADLFLFFGADETHEDDAERAVQAALALRQAAEAEGLAVSIGITTGIAHVQRQSDDRGVNITVTGPTVQLAPRLRNRSGSNQILLDRNTYRATNGLIDSTEGSITLPGTATAVATFLVGRRRSRAVKARGIEGLHAALIGRQTELTQLHAILERLQSGTGQVVAIVGQAGVGKSRLAAELKQWAAHQFTLTENAVDRAVNTRTILWLEGRGLEYANTTSYSLFADLLRGYWSGEAGHNGHQLADNLRTTLQTLYQAGYLESDAVEEFGPLLGRLLAVRYHTAWDEQLSGIDPNQLHQRMVVAVRELFAAIAQRQSLVLVFEDLQWADTLSLELITALLGLPATAPLLILCLYRREGTQRDERLATLARQHCPERFTELRLRELTPAQGRELLVSMLVREQLSSPVREFILREAQGNPLFLEEVVRVLIDGGQLYRIAETWRSDETINRLTIPETLQRIVLSRADRLPIETRRLLQQAAVLGRLFHLSVLSAMNEDLQEIEGALALLTARAWIYLERALPEAEYSFHHVLVRDAIYQELPQERRCAYHRRAAEAIEILNTENCEPVIEQLAYHYDQSGVAAKAVHYLLLAGQKALRVYANAEALSYFRRAEEYVEEGADIDPMQRLTLLDGIGQVYVTLSDLEHGEPYLRQAIALAKELNLPAVEQARRYFPLCHLLGWLGDSASVQALTDEGLALLDGDLHHPEAIMLTTFQSEFYFNRGKHRTAMALFAQVVEQLPELGYDRQLLSAYNMVAMWCRYTKAIGQGFDLLNRVEAEATAQRDLWTVGYLHGWPIMFLHETIGNLDGVIQSLEKFEEVARRTGDEILNRQAHTFRSMVHGWLMGEWETAIEHANAAIAITERVERMREDFFSYVTLGLAEFSRQQWQAAAEFLEIARRLSFAQNFRADGNRRGDIGLAWCYHQLGRHDDAVDLFQSVVAEEEADIESLHLITCALAGLAATLPDLAVFRQACYQIEVKRDPVGPLALVQWHEERAEICNQQRKCIATLPNDHTACAAAGWQWRDPVGDSWYRFNDGLVIHSANYRDLWLNNRGAPHLVRAIEGDFVLEAVCSSTTLDALALGGLLLWQSQENYLRLTWNTHGPGEVNLLGCLHNQDRLLGRGRASAAGTLHLRMERQHARVRALYSVDGQQWYSIGAVEFAAGNPVQIGLLGIGFVPRYVHAGSYQEGSTIHFHSCRIWQ